MSTGSVGMDFLSEAMHGPVAQAVAAALATADALGRTHRVAGAWAAAAARGAAAGLAAQRLPAQNSKALEEFQDVLRMLGVDGAGAASKLLLAAGQAGLARRVRRASRARNAMAHPDGALVSDVAAFVADTVNGEDDTMGMEYEVVVDDTDNTTGMEYEVVVDEGGPSVDPGGVYYEYGPMAYDGNKLADGIFSYADLEDGVGQGETLGMDDDLCAGMGALMASLPELPAFPTFVSESGGSDGVGERDGEGGGLYDLQCRVRYLRNYQSQLCNEKGRRAEKKALDKEIKKAEEELQAG
mmetsp:Transcript_22559/g.64036  ORF Transcript_22559/g.64036 Transcript_22559/m.64036 type:complete len:298 (+) Transcript_22559:54-947(+)